MPGMTYTNPFTPETPVGQGLQNIAVALFNGRQAQQRNALEETRKAYYDALAGKASAEAENARRRGFYLTPEAIDESVAASFAVPPSRVRELRTLPAPGTTAMPPATPFLPNARAIGERLLAVRTAMANKSDPASLALGDQRFNETRRRDAVIDGELDPRRVAQAFFSTSGKAPYAGRETGSTDLLTGAQQLNDIGVQRASREAAQGRNFNAQAAGHEEENSTGVKMGAPVIVAGEDGQPPVYVAPRAALGRNPGLNPNSAAARPRSGGAGDTTTETDIVPIKPTKADMDLLLGAIDRAAGGKLADDTLTSAIMQRAEEYFRTPGSKFYGNHEGASRAAVADILPDGAEMSGMLGFRKFGPRGEPRFDLGPIQITEPTTRKRTVTRGAQSATTPAAQPPAKPPAGNAPPRPAGKTDQQLIDEANDAIRRGAPRDAVMQRLQAWGVQVS